MLPSSRDLEILLALAVASIPGLYAWWSGRKLIPNARSPALPEIVFEHRRGLARVALFSIVLVVFLSRAHSGMAALCLGLLAILGMAIGAFPARRALFEESWGLGAYLSHQIRFYLAFFGFWFLLATTPGIIQSAGAAWRIEAAILGAILLGWKLFFVRAFVGLLLGRPLDRPDLQPRFETVVSRSRVAMPSLFRAGSPGSRWSNAIALPSTRRSAVLFSETLLESLDPDEIAAIFAHEVAHLEHYDKLRLRRLAFVVCAAIGTALSGFVFPFLGDRAMTSFLGFLATLGALALVLAVTQAASPGEDRRRGVVPVVGVLSIVILLSWAPVARVGWAGAATVQWAARHQTNAFVAPLALSAALLTVPRRRARAAAAAVAFLGVAPLVFTTASFARRYNGDPFLAQAPELDVTTEMRLGPSVLLREWSTPRRDGWWMDLRLSPTARRFAAFFLSEDTEDEDASSASFLVGDFSGGHRNLDALAAEFVDDESVLAIVESEGVLTLEILPAEGTGGPSWSRSLPPMEEPVLMVDRAVGSWWVAGIDPDRRQVVQVLGLVGQGEPVEKRLALPDFPWPIAGLDPDGASWDPDHPPSVYGHVTTIPRRDGPLITASRFETPSSSWWAFLSGGETSMTSDLWSLDPTPSSLAGGTNLGIECTGVSPRAQAVACLAVDGQRTLVWLVEPDRGRLDCIGVIPGASLNALPVGDGRVAVPTGNDAVLVDTTSRKATRLTIEPGRSEIEDWAFVPGFAGVLTTDEKETTLSVYAIP